ncbi:TPA: YitT family protein [Citrobacter farmeri]
MLAKHYKNIFMIVLGAAIMAFGLYHFIIENGLAEGSFTGIALIFHHTLGVRTSLALFLLNIPVFIVGWFLLGKQSMIYSLAGMLSLTLWLALFEKWHFQFALQYLLVAAVLAGIFLGAGLGIIFRFGGTTGGVEIIARIIHKNYAVDCGISIFIQDCLVILMSVVFYLDIEKALCTIVALFILSRLVDKIGSTSPTVVDVVHG